VIEPNLHRPGMRPVRTSPKSSTIASRQENRIPYWIDSRYPGQGAQGLIDGKIGSTEYQDGSWQGREQEDLVATIDLGEAATLSKIGSRFLQDIDPWIFFPTRVVYEISEDGTTFRTVATVQNDIPADRQAR
jgi:hypothetical protein